MIRSLLTQRCDLSIQQLIQFNPCSVGIFESPANFFFLLRRTLSTGLLSEVPPVNSKIVSVCPNFLSRVTAALVATLYHIHMGFANLRCSSNFSR